MATRHSTANGFFQPERKASLSGVARVADQRMKGAALRAIEANQRVCSKAKRLMEEIDDLTPVHGVPVTNLSDEDSLVTTVAAVIAANGK